MEPDAAESSPHGEAPNRGSGPRLSLRVRLIGGLLILLFLALFSLAVVVFVWQRLTLPPEYLYAALVVAIAGDLLLLGLVADYRLRVLVLRPVAQMVEGAESIAGGHEEHRLPASDTKELDRLSSAVNEMAGRLIRHQQVLTANVESLAETNRELSAARSRLVRADKMASIGHLAAGVAHEIGNPLGAIMGYVELGRRTGEAESEWLSGISHESRRIDSIVRGLLDFARPKAATPRPVHVNGAIRRAAQLMQVQGRLRDVEMRMDLADDLPPVRADPFQLEQVLVNLLLNAADAVDAIDANRWIHLVSKTAEVTARESSERFRRRMDDPIGTDYSHIGRLAQAADPGPSAQLREGQTAVEIAVSDSGDGIADADVRQIFDPFFTTKPPGRGTGLGLPVSARLVEGMGGTMEALPGAGKGATFRILLPVAVEGGE